MRLFLNLSAYLSLPLLVEAFSATSPSSWIGDTWSLLVLGDLHMEDDMSRHEQARRDCLNACQKLSLMAPSNHPQQTVREIFDALQDSRCRDLTSDQLELMWRQSRDPEWMNTFMVSLGDLGRKDIRHEQGDAGTTLSFELAKSFFDGFGGMPYLLVTGNHDLEGLDEFEHDADNLQAWMDCFGLDKPYCKRYLGEKTVLLGLSTVRFRDAPFSSHEVHVDDEQIEWFVRTVEEHPAEDGWKILVASHAPIMGSGLRVLQNVHVTNGCAWLNHCSENRNVFIQTVNSNPQIKLWFSGHFHLSHDHPDSISTIGSCTFVQVGVMGPVSTRDGRRQTRLVQGDSEKLRLYSINHHSSSEDCVDLRLDLEIDLVGGTFKRTQQVEEADREHWFHAYVPREEDGCYIETPDGSIAGPSSSDKVCWWHMADGKVIGLHQKQLVEYDSETLSPLGVVVNEQELSDRTVMVVEKGTVLVLLDEETKEIEVVHPNDDGSYWRRYQRNKRVRQAEKLRESIAKVWLEKQAQR